MALKLDRFSENVLYVLYVQSTVSEIEYFANNTHKVSHGAMWISL